MPHASLEAVSQALLKAVDGNEATYKTVATRITLRTGVNVHEAGEHIPDRAAVPTRHHPRAVPAHNRHT